eukprot:Skav216276  [mRNA]  locus=scaffold951:126267:127026:+ [translate_table: standard]
MEARGKAESALETKEALAESKVLKEKGEKAEDSKEKEKEKEPSECPNMIKHVEIPIVAEDKAAGSKDTSKDSKEKDDKKKGLAGSTKMMAAVEEAFKKLGVNWQVRIKHGFNEGWR